MAGNVCLRCIPLVDPNSNFVVKRGIFGKHALTLFYILINGVRYVEEDDSLNVHFWPFSAPEASNMSVRFYPILEYRSIN